VSFACQSRLIASKRSMARSSSVSSSSTRPSARASPPPPRAVFRPPEGPLGVVLVGHRCAERRHDCVAGELLDRAAGGSDLGGHLVVEPVEKGARPFRILLVGKRRRADEIREHDRDELSLHLPVSYRAVISSIATWTLSPRL